MAAPAGSEFPWSDGALGEFLTRMARTHVSELNSLIKAVVDEAVAGVTYASSMSLIEISGIRFYHAGIRDPTVMAEGCRILRTGEGCRAECGFVVTLDVLHAGKVETTSDVDFSWVSGTTSLRLKGLAAFRMDRGGHLMANFDCREVTLAPGSQTFAMPISLDTARSGHLNAAYWKTFTTKNYISGLSGVVLRLVLSHYQTQLRDALSIAKTHDLGVFPVTSAQPEPARWVAESLFWLSVDKKLGISLGQGSASWLKALAEAPQATRDQMLTGAIKKLVPLDAFVASDDTTLSVRPGEVEVRSLSGSTDEFDRLCLDLSFAWRPSGHIRMVVKKEYFIGLGQGHITIDSIAISGRVLFRAAPCGVVLLSATLLELSHSAKAWSNDVIIKKAANVQKEVDQALEKFRKDNLGVERVLLNSWSFC